MHAGAIRRLVLDFSGVNYVDSSAMHALHEVVHELHIEVCRYTTTWIYYIYADGYIWIRIWGGYD